MSSPSSSLSAASPATRGTRLTLALDGLWDVGESVAAADRPRTFPARVPVPGLVNLAQPPFPQVDEFVGAEVQAFRANVGEIPDAERVPPPGRSSQPRNYFWYRRVFRAPAGRSVARLTIGKAQFGTAVWLNGMAQGEAPACFSASHFDLTPAIRWDADNELVVRIGAHPGVLPADHPAGTDFEKFRFTPGIYDRVTIACCDDPFVASVQVAPRLAPPAIVVQTRVVNRGAAVAEGVLAHRVGTWPDHAPIASAAAEPLRLLPGEERVITRTIPLPADTRRWSPDDPCLHVVETSTGADTVVTRFGLREFRGDAATGRFLLNGEPCYLRGSNIAFHRFLEDPDCGALPWDEAWVRRLLGEIPRQLHWNAFRFTLGPAPQRWFEIADECGLLIQNEFFLWTSHPKWHAPKYSRSWDKDELVRQYGAWMADHWNHPSVVIWDACNETFDPVFGETVIPAVRGLDLSDRPWENAYNPAVAADDPVEIHPYFHLTSHFDNRLQFALTELETATFESVAKLGAAEPNWPGHPLIVNEYAWLWLNRDGTPTHVADRVYPMLLGPNSTAEERFRYYAYDVAAETECFRAIRRFAGVMHFVYLTYSKPCGYTSDPFRDIRTLKLDPYFAEWVAEAFKPLGVFLRFFQPTLAGGASRRFPVTLVNDRGGALQGMLTLTLESEAGEVVARTEQPFAIAGFGTTGVELELAVPRRRGRHWLKATAGAAGLPEAPTVSRRFVDVTEG